MQSIVCHANAKLTKLEAFIRKMDQELNATVSTDIFNSNKNNNSKLQRKSDHCYKQRTILTPQTFIEIQILRRFSSGSGRYRTDLAAGTTAAREWLPFPPMTSRFCCGWPKIIDFSDQNFWLRRKTSDARF
jgi:hypothetical protein